MVLGERQQAVHETYGMPCIHSPGFLPSSCCFIALEVLQLWWQLREDLGLLMPSWGKCLVRLWTLPVPPAVQWMQACVGVEHRACTDPASPHLASWFLPNRSLCTERPAGDKGCGGQLQPTPALFCAETKNIAVPTANPSVFQNLH